MILPRSRLIWWCGLWLVPLALLAALAPGLRGLPVLVAALVLVAPVLDALLAVRSLRGITAKLPDLVRLTHNAPGEIVLSLGNESAQGVKLRVGLPMPPELACREEDLLVRLPAQAKAATFAFPCLAARRGRYLLQRCYLGAASPLGFWLARGEVPLQSEVRVYPNLSDDRRRLAALFLNRGGPGSHAQRQVGRGRDFERLREYIQGDPYEEIHWKATARHARPITKVFQLERTQEVYVALDASRLSARVPGVSAAGEPSAPAGQTSLDLFISAAMVMGLVAERQGDHFGLLTFSDRVDRFIRARSGKGHYRACRETIYALQSRPVTPDFAEVFSFIRLRLRRRALVILLTDLDDPILAENLTQASALIARQHLLLVSMIRPPGAEEIFSAAPETPQSPAGLEDVYRDLVGHMQWSRLRQMGQVLRTRGIGFCLAPSAELCADVARQYLDIKKRQLL